MTRQSLGVRALSHPGPHRLDECVRTIQHTLAVAGDNLLGPWVSSSRMIAEPAAPTPDTTMRTSGNDFADDPQRVAQGGEHHDSGAVLIVMENRNVQDLPQPRLDLEAAWRGDVLEVDAAVRRGEVADRCR